MAKLMWIAGILLVAIGVALGLMVFFSPASIVGWGLTPDTAVMLLVGGLLCLGLGSVVDGLAVVAQARSVTVTEPAYAPAAIPEFGRKAAEPVAAVAAAATVAAETVSPQVQQTIEALEQAKQDLRQAFEPKAEEEAVTGISEPEPVAEPEPEPTPAEEPIPAAEEPAEEEVLEEGQLYVIEERTIRNRPARILSDGTVEAETEEGWMRFENLEHLDEYLDAMAPPARA